MDEIHLGEAPHADPAKRDIPAIPQGANKPTIYAAMHVKIGELTRECAALRVSRDEALTRARRAEDEVRALRAEVGRLRQDAEVYASALTHTVRRQQEEYAWRLSAEATLRESAPSGQSGRRTLIPPPPDSAREVGP